MLNDQQQQQLDALLASLSTEQRIWLAGYVNGRVGGGQPSAEAVPAQVELPRIQLYYATESGNSKALTLEVMKALKAAGFKAKNTALNRVKLTDIDPATPTIFLTSTHGEGDPPEGAVPFFRQLAQATDGALRGLPYAVLGLGDSSYDIFCGAAVTLDEAMQRLGGSRLQETALFDVDYSDHTPGWMERIVATLRDYAAPQPASNVSVRDVEAPAAEMPTLRTGPGYSRLQPIAGEVREIINLNDRGSAKETYHIEIALDNPDVTYTPGDAVGIILPTQPDGQEPAPRLYSIASAPSLHEGEVHLTVALANHVQEDGSIGYGLASRYLADRQEGDTLQLYISQNQMFNLPGDDQDAIMIGPGTGIAPFRSFIHERAERGAGGRNWLFFGEQHAHCDFLYQAEWQEHLATESLHRLDLAFSRDRAEKIYVQHRLSQAGREVLDWLEGGAALYLCGNKDPMSRDVEQALVGLLMQGHGWEQDKALDYLAEMEEHGRYQKDVY